MRWQASVNLTVAGRGGLKALRNRGATRTVTKHQIHRSKVYHTIQEIRCRLCREVSQTVQPIVAGCKMQVGTAYTKCSRLVYAVAGIVYRNFCSA